jgi:hypothetical protein
LASRRDFRRPVGNALSSQPRLPILGHSIPRWSIGVHRLRRVAR